MTGIYKIINKINGKMYIGSAVDIQKRWIKHKSDLRKNKHHSKKLQNSWNKYGEQNFIFEIVEECEKNKDLLLSKESYYFILYDTVKNGYNCAIKAGSPMFGKKHSEETKKKISKSNKGRKHSEETREKLKKRNLNNKYNFGKKHSPETIEKIRASNLGKNLNKKNSEQTRYKISKSNKGKKHSEETKEKLKISQWGKDRVFTEEHRKKLSKSQIGEKNHRYNPNKVIQYDLNDNFIKEWKDLVTLKNKGFNSGHISAVCRGIKKTYLGFKWKFK